MALPGNVNVHLKFSGCGGWRETGHVGIQVENHVVVSMSQGGKSERITLPQSVNHTREVE